MEIGMLKNTSEKQNWIPECPAANERFRKMAALSLVDNFSYFRSAYSR
jgi:hypothetical protein